MLSADFIAALAGPGGEARKDRYAVQASQELGRQVVDLASCQLKYPVAYPQPLYKLFANKYGIDQSPHCGRFETQTSTKSPPEYRTFTKVIMIRASKQKASLKGCVANFSCSTFEVGV